MSDAQRLDALTTRLLDLADHVAALEKNRLFLGVSDMAELSRAVARHINLEHLAGNIDLAEITTRLGDRLLDSADLLDEAEALIPDNRADLDNDTTSVGSVKIFPPTIENELDALPPHEGHGGAV